MTFWIIDYDLEKGFASKRPLLMAEKYAFLGEEEKTLDWLEMAFEQHSLEPFKNNPFYKNIKTEPRFIALLEKMCLADN